MADVYDDLSAWLKDRPSWQQEAAVRILKAGGLSDQDIDELVAACKTPEGTKRSSSRHFPGLVRSASLEGDVCIESLGPVEGIEGLAPRKPLGLGTRRLTVVFGGNGAGKSGYVRILRALTGKTDANGLRTNVFAKNPLDRKCGIAYRVGAQRADVEWLVGDPIAALRTVDIFDSDVGRHYISKENEASYTPPVVSLLEQLAAACDRVREKLKLELDSLRSALPRLPSEYANTATGKAYESLRADLDDNAIESLFGWTPELGRELEVGEERLRTDDPDKSAREKKARAAQVDGILTRLKSALATVTLERCREIATLRQAAGEARAAATEGVRVVRRGGDLRGVGGATWRALWESARKYSTTEAYAGMPFPQVGDGARCVLCQQGLSTEARQRLEAFENFVSGELETSAGNAERVRDERLQGLPTRPEPASLVTACVAAGLPIDTWGVDLESAWDKIDAAAVALRSGGDWELACAKLGEIAQRFAALKDVASQLRRQAQQHEADASGHDRAATASRLLDLRARKWTSQQIESVRSEAYRLRQVSRLKELQATSSAIAFSKKASEVAESLITGEYVGRFNDELTRLGASQLRVELVKTRALHGKVLHRILLKGAAQAAGVGDVLSEGEKRVVELAAFLADVTGKPTKGPFIFDDPISSLDQDFEERTAERLVSLSEERQVVVFTHRLSLLGLLSKASDGHIHIRQQPWGAGEPGELSLFAKRPENALTNLKNSRLAQAARILETTGAEDYYALAKGICSDVRILTERLIETGLLGGVIERHVRDVKTKGLLVKLARIETSDCEFLDGVMTKYSAFEHSQSREAPGALPSPDELRADIDALVNWYSEFSERTPREQQVQGGKPPGQMTVVQ